MSKPTKYNHLFSPITIGAMKLENRAVMPAMATGYANMDNTPSDRLVQYLARRAKGGTGLIITEVTAVTPRGKGFPNELGIWSDDFISPLAKIPQAIHREGGKAAIQLHHAGRETFQEAAHGLPEAPSAIPSVILGQPCEEMSIERIHEVINAFASATVRARSAGFDAVEIHSAHGYLLNQFLSPFSNQRQDAYGGSEENRSRFVLEVISAARKAVGQDFPIIVRVSADELIRGGFDLEFMKRLAPQLVVAGADALHVSVGVYSTPGSLSIASMDTPPGFNLFRARAIKATVNVPVIGVGRISDPELAEQALERGDADLISFGRQHLTDPDFISKSKSGDLDDIRPCVACNQGCIERLSFEMKSATCSFNPECGQEFRGSSLSDAPKKVWVIGAGPAGLSAALAACERGHKVEVFEREDSPGGQLRSASKPPHKQDHIKLLNCLSWQLEKLGVERNVGKKVSLEMVGRLKPDVVVVATGAMPLVPAITGVDCEEVTTAWDILRGQEAGRRVLVIGGGMTGIETAEFLAQKGKEVVVVEQLKRVGADMGATVRWHLMNRIGTQSIQMLTSTKVKEIQPKGRVVVSRNGSEETLEAFDTIVLACGVNPGDMLSAEIRGTVEEVYVIGDAFKPRRGVEAIRDGSEIGRKI